MPATKTTAILAGTDAARPPQSLREAWVALAGLSAVFLFEMLDTSILNVALPTLGRELQASTTELQWVTGAYAVVFGCLMLPFGAVADRFGRRRVMLAGLALLGLSSLGTAFVTSAGQLIAVRIAMGVAAAMTTPGSMALAFRLFQADRLRMSAITLISTVGLVGMAIGPTVGGFVLVVAPWQALLLVNVPIAALALAGIRVGIPADRPEELHRASLRSLLDLSVLTRPLVASGLAYKAAAGLATAGMGYLVTLQLQLDWGWTPAMTAIGMLPQVLVLIAGGAVINPLVDRVGPERAAWLSAVSVVAGLAGFSLLGRFGYGWVALSLVLVAAGMRVVGVVAGVTVLNGLPENRTGIGTALIDTVSEVSSGIGIAVAGTVLATLFTGAIATANWTAQQTGEFRQGVLAGGLTLTAMAAALVGFGLVRSRRRPTPR